MAIKISSAIIFLLVVMIMGASTAVAVTLQPLTPKISAAYFVTPKLAERAVVDVQIRRIKHLISHQRIDPDVAFDRLERLQNQLRDR